MYGEHFARIFPRERERWISWFEGQSEIIIVSLGISLQIFSHTAESEFCFYFGYFSRLRATKNILE